MEMFVDVILQFFFAMQQQLDNHLSLHCSYEMEKTALSQSRNTGMSHHSKDLEKSKASSHRHIIKELMHEHSASLKAVVCMFMAHNYIPGCSCCHMSK